MNFIKNYKMQNTGKHQLHLINLFRPHYEIGGKTDTSIMHQVLHSLHLKYAIRMLECRDERKTGSNRWACHLLL